MKPEVIRGYLNAQGVLLKDIAVRHKVSGSYLSRILRGTVDDTKKVREIKADICNILGKELQQVFPQSTPEQNAA